VTEAVIKLIERIIDLYVLILIINAILSWLIAFNVLNTQNRFVFSVLEFSYKLTDPPLNYIRKFIPNLGSVDISPVILILILWFIKDLI
jgi:YggT family protein